MRYSMTIQKIIKIQFAFKPKRLGLRALNKMNYWEIDLRIQKA